MKERVSDDRGQAVTSILMVVGMLTLGFAMIGLLPLGQAGDQRGRLQTSADAAALAGAQEIIRQAPSGVGFFLNSKAAKQPFTCNQGQAAASTFAAKNGATLISYSACPGDVVRVVVRSKETLASGEKETFSARASVGIKLGPCVHKGPPAKVGMVSCGALKLKYVTGPPAVLFESESKIKKHFTARLVS